MEVTTCVVTSIFSREALPTPKHGNAVFLVNENHQL